MDRLPVDVTVEYRGVKPPSEFTRRDTGQVFPVPAKLKFEHRTANGDVMLIEVSGSQLDKVDPPLDYDALKVGERVHLSGEAVIQDRGSDKDSFVMWDAAERVKPAAAVRSA